MTGAAAELVGLEACGVADGFADGLGWGFGLGFGDDAAACLGGAWPGWLRAVLPFQENATEPPSGIRCEPAPALAEVHEPDVPFDHHRPQYAAAGGVF